MLVYLISCFGVSLMSALFIRASISVGASGALFGLIGSMLSELITNWSLYANKVCFPNIAVDSSVIRSSIIVVVAAN